MSYLSLYETESYLYETEQEVLDHVRTYFSQPGAQLAVESGTYNCMYRTDDGRACAIGCLIPDDIYQPEFEGNPVLTILPDLNEARVFGPNISERFLYRLQRLHDDSRLSSATHFVSQLEGAF